VVSEPPKNKKGLRAKNGEHRITKCLEKSKEFGALIKEEYTRRRPSSYGAARKTAAFA
jgi:hypothetical protein